VPNHSETWRNSPELLLLKFLPLAYHHSHFLTATLDFTSFFTTGAAHFFYNWAVFGIGILLLIIPVTKHFSNEMCF